MKIELTEDQIKDISDMIQNWIPAANFTIEGWEKPLEVKSSMHPDYIRYYNEHHEQALKTKAKLAFRLRILSTLAKAKTQSNS